MHKLIPFGSLTALVIGVFVAMTVAGAFDDDDPQPSGEGVSAAMCVEGVEDCDDTVAIPVDGDEPVVVRCEDLPDGCEIIRDPPIVLDSEALAIEAAFAELEAISRVPAPEADVSEVRSVDWPNACLGVDTPGIACAQVITPGFIVFLSGAAGDYEFHTDTNGNAVFVAND